MADHEFLKVMSYTVLVLNFHSCSRYRCQSMWWILPANATWNMITLMSDIYTQEIQCGPNLEIFLKNKYVESVVGISMYKAICQKMRKMNESLL